MQFGFRNSKLRETAIQTNHNLWKYPHSGFLQTFDAGKMNVHLRAEFALVARRALPTSHGLPLELTAVY
jgi:hypothetical protein